MAKFVPTMRKMRPLSQTGPIEVSFTPRGPRERQTSLHPSNLPSHKASESRRDDSVSTEVSKKPPSRGFTDVMMGLNMNDMQKLSAEFARHSKGLTMQQFVSAMCKALRDWEASKLEMVTLLIEMFREIDINGDQSMEWDEFVSFIVESGMVFPDNSKVDAVESYSASEVKDSSVHKQGIEKVQYFPTWDKLVVSEKNKIVKLYDPATLHVTQTLQGPHLRSTVLASEYIPEHTLLATATADCTVQFWDTQTYERKRQMRVDRPQHALQWAGPLQTLFTASTTGTIYAWSLSNPEAVEQRHKLDGHTDVCMDILLLNNSHNLASASLDTTVRVWDGTTGEERQRLEGHAKGVYALTFNQTYHFLISAGFDRDAYIWNPFSRRLVNKLSGHSTSLIGVKCMPDTPQIITADRDGIFKIWDVRNFQCVQTFNSSSGGVIGLQQFTVAPQYKRIIAVSSSVHYFDYARPATPTLTDELPTVCALFNDISSTFCTATAHDVKVWNKNGVVERVYRQPVQSEITCFATDDRRRKLIIGTHSGEIECFNYSNGATMKSFQSHSAEVSCLLYCDAAKIVITGSWDKTVRIHDELEASHGVTIKTLTGHQGEVTCIAYSPGMALIASGDTKKEVRIWDFDRAQYDASLPETFEAEITALTFLETYPALLVADGSGTVTLWAMRPSTIRMHCVYRFVNKHEDPLNTTLTPTPPIPTAVTVMCYDNAKQQLFTGDELGYIRCWDFADLMPKTNIKPLNFHGKLRYEPLPNNRRSREDDTSYMKPSALATPADFVVPKLDKHYLKMGREWRAHRDLIKHLTILREPLAEPTLMSISYDRVVRFWSCDTGESLGCLQQGRGLTTKPEQLRKWNVNIDLRAREAAENHYIQELVKWVEQQPPDDWDAETVRPSGAVTARQVQIPQLQVPIKKPSDAFEFKYKGTVLEHDMIARLLRGSSSAREEIQAVAFAKPAKKPQQHRPTDAEEPSFFLTQTPAERKKA
eukprot:TRINITY_DN4837_c0_g1_i1.p1 TRINITY_DN4837_c0_g1~~TRINITY_DN4837_c0_g1_i1.p1  ORF type:complete len:989 (+),score=200.34 TRINITY_DN4837_c0_g1_i1:54-3020(+)